MYLYQILHTVYLLSCFHRCVLANFGIEFLVLIEGSCGSKSEDEI